MERGVSPVGKKMLLFLSECCAVLARYSEYFAGVVAGVEEAKAKAALIGLHALKDLQGPVILELDCQIRIKELMTGKQSLSPCYGLLRDIKQALTYFSIIVSVAWGDCAMPLLMGLQRWPGIRKTRRGLRTYRTASARL